MAKKYCLSQLHQMLHDAHLKVGASKQHLSTLRGESPDDIDIIPLPSDDYDDCIQALVDYSREYTRLQKLVTTAENQKRQFDNEANEELNTALSALGLGEEKERG